MSDDRTELTRRWAARCDELEAENATLKAERDELRTHVSEMENVIAAMARRETAILTAMERIALQDRGE